MLALLLSDKFCCFGIFVFVFNCFLFFRFSSHHFFVLILVFVSEFVIFSFSPFSFSVSLTKITLMAQSLNAEQRNKYQQQMLQIMQLDEVHRDAGYLAELTSGTFVDRRQLINARTSIREVWSHYPALFTISGIIADYASMAQQPLTSRKKLALIGERVLQMTHSADGKSRSRSGLKGPDVIAASSGTLFLRRWRSNTGGVG